LPTGEIGNVPPELPLAERLDGLASSLLVMLDGDAINGGWRLAWIDENFVAQGGSESIAGTLHEQWAERKRGA
jgi:hypothetical protein